MASDALVRLGTMLEELAERIRQAILESMDSDIGINRKIGVNTLRDSQLRESVSVQAISEDTIVFEIAEYYENVVQGRESGLKIDSQMIESLRLWIRRKGIHFQGTDENGTLWLVCKSIVEKGIAPRPFIRSGERNNEDPSRILVFLDSYFADWADDVYDMIVNAINKQLQIQ